MFERKQNLMLFLHKPFFFSQDFASTGYTWTESLCKTDSDLDGLTNGEELGDPQCTWRVGNNVALNDPKGHPGMDTQL